MKNGGVRPGAGRKSKAEEMGLAALLNKCWPERERELVIKKLCALAKAGNDKAAALLLAYCYGKPTEKHEHGGEGGGPIEVVVTYVSKPATG